MGSSQTSSLVLLVPRPTPHPPRAPLQVQHQPRHQRPLLLQPLVIVMVAAWSPALTCAHLMSLRHAPSPASTDAPMCLCEQPLSNVFCTCAFSRCCDHSTQWVP